MSANSRYAPEFRVEIGGSAIPATLRASITGVTLDSGLEGADRAELHIVNENLRWLDNDLFRLDEPLALHLGYAPDPLEQVFVGNIVGTGATFPANGGPTLTVTAQDRRHRLQEGTKVRWFAIPIPTVGNFPIPDLATASLVSLENLLIPIFDPVGAAISVLLGGVEAVASISDPGGAQKFIRKQADESDYDFLARIAKENGWDMFVEHSGALGGHLLRFQSPLGHLEPDVTLKYGRTLIDFTPRVSAVGQIFTVTGYVWVPAIKLVFTVSLGWDWDRMALTLSVYPGVIPLGQKPGSHHIKEPFTPVTAPRKLISTLIPKLNKRLTGTGTTLGRSAVMGSRPAPSSGSVSSCRVCDMSADY